MINIENGKVTNYDELISRLEDFLSSTVFNKLPEFAKKKIRMELDYLKELLLNSRLPKIAIVGRTQSGKSSLINCIFGEKTREEGDGTKPKSETCEWQSFQSQYGQIKILDSRGIIDDITDTNIEDSKAEKSFFDAIKKESPDIIIYLHKAKEFASLNNNELNIIKKMIQKVEHSNGSFVPLIGVISHIDSMFARSDPWPPIEHYQMQEIENQKKAFSDKICRIIEKDNLLSIFPVCTLTKYDSKGNINYSRSDNWGIEPLVEFIINSLPKDAQLKMAVAARINTTLNSFSNKIISIFATLSAAIGVQPIPFGDLPVLVSLQLSMIITIAYIGKGKISIEDAKDFLIACGANIGFGYGMRELARALLKLIPVAGNIGSGALAAAGTFAIGRAASAYFIDGVSVEDVKKIFKKNNKAEIGENFVIKE
jgi:uncharacterized protein (DUF697 family)/GTPase SAR1 family protein